ncbi:hypothetical protein [Streptomyces sp. NPDC096351]|uniref:hypothetical protein n=1 Tax=Streptomyces sp. NPDC096351 TaxID=3366087 RepID=UPI003801E85F
MPEPEHVCRPDATVYYCPTAGEVESDCHGGFDTCCSRPELHRFLDPQRHYLVPVARLELPNEPDVVHWALLRWMPAYETWATGMALCGHSAKQGPLPDATEVTCARCAGLRPDYERYIAPGYDPAEDDPRALRARLRLAQQHAHSVDAERAEAAARLLETQAALERANARTARIHAEAVNAHAAVAAVRRLCALTVEASVRVQAVEQARDTLTVLAECGAGELLPGDGAWGSVWLHGNWRYLTSQMTTPEREHAADAVARWSADLARADGEERGREPESLRWWRDLP